MDFREACRQGNLAQVFSEIEKGTYCLDDGLSHACMGGQMSIAELMISKIADQYNSGLMRIYWKEICLNGGLFYACKYGHLNLIKLLISNGANGWDYALEGACAGGQLVIAE